jgi:hypothetical protein
MCPAPSALIFLTFHFIFEPWRKVIFCLTTFLCTTPSRSVGVYESLNTVSNQNFLLPRHNDSLEVDVLASLLAIIFMLSS